MQTSFTPDQLSDPNIAAANDILRSCVHCGFCNATCPTYLLTGDERDGPRGRIYMIRDLLQDDRAPGVAETRHLDRCLSCLSCMTTCPASVDYMHLIDPMRDRITAAGKRGAGGNLLRRLVARLLSDGRLVYRMLRLARPLRGVLRKLPGLLGRMGRLIPDAPPVKPQTPQVFPAEGDARYRVALLAGCVQQPIAPGINDATIRVLRHAGCEVEIVSGTECCGSLHHHMGQAEAARRRAAAAIEAWAEAEREKGPFDAVIANASGCGTMLKDYGDLFCDNEALAEPARRISASAADISEFLQRIGYEPPSTQLPVRKVAWQSPCSLRHGQGQAEPPVTLMQRAGFEVVEPAEAHICCGSAGTYNLFEPELAEGLRRRKLEALAALDADLVVSANIGCMVQLSSGLAMPTLHVIELLDWVIGGPPPGNARREGGS